MNPLAGSKINIARIQPDPNIMRNLYPEGIKTKEKVLKENTLFNE
jgi:hypothetical protein